MKIWRMLFAGLAWIGLGLTPVSASADTLQMKDGRVMQGKFLGGTQASVQFEVNGKIELYNVDQVISLTFTGAPAASSASQFAPPPAPMNDARPASTAKRGSSVMVPAGTSLMVRMIDSVDSDKNHVGDRFRASLEQDLAVDGVVVAPKGADVYGRLAEAKEAGHFEGKSQLKLELTGILINNRLQPVMSGDYEVSGSSRGSNTAKKVGIGAVAGTVIGAIAGGGKGAAIGAGVGAGAGAAVQVMTKGEQVHVPSETLLDFRIEQSFNVEVR
jgi:YmgG-like glycine-zipper protein